MRRLRLPSRSSRQLLLILLIAFSARALIPTGFMPGPGGVILCPGQMPASASIPQSMAGMDMVGMTHHPEHPSHLGGSTVHVSSSLCAFAAAATTMASGHTAALFSPPAVESGAVKIPVQSFVPSGTIVPTPFPRGPPTLA